jgi:hypothetical protein
MIAQTAGRLCAARFDVQNHPVFIAALLLLNADPTA